MAITGLNFTVLYKINARGIVVNAGHVTEIVACKKLQKLFESGKQGQRTMGCQCKDERTWGYVGEPIHPFYRGD